MTESAKIETPAGDGQVANAAPPANAAPADAKPAAGDTLLTAKVDDKPVSAPADWPTDWREKLAGTDTKSLDQLKRYGAPGDVWAKARALEQKMSSGEYKRDLPKDATPEQVAEWRKEQGLPDKADGYLEKLALPTGMVLGEADKPVALAFAQAAFDGNASPEQFSKLVAQYYKMEDQVKQQRVQADQDFRQKAEDTLRGEWGQDYHPNLNAANNILSTMPEGISEQFMGGRLADGTKIGDNPGVLKWLANMSREMNPVATLVPGGGGTVQGAESRLAEIRKYASENPDAYDNNKSMKEEQIRLNAALSKMRGRAA